MHHPKVDVDRLYIPRKPGGRGLVQLEITYKTTTIGLNTYLSNKDSTSIFSKLRGIMTAARKQCPYTIKPQNTGENLAYQEMKKQRMSQPRPMPEGSS